MGSSGSPQGPGRDGDRGAGRDHVVDDEHTQPRHASRSCGDRRTRPPIDRGSAGLRWTRASVEERTARTTEASCDRTRQELGLVEAALSPAVGGRRYPRDDVDALGIEVDERRHLPRQPAQRAASVAVLQAGDQLAARALVRQQHVAPVDTWWWRERRRRHQLARAIGAWGGAGVVTQRAGARQQHAHRCTQAL